MITAQPTPGTPSLMRAINDRAALQALLQHGSLTRPELSDLTGLSKPTASQLLNRLRDAGLVILDGRREGLPGRTAETYRINPRLAYICALDVSGARINAVVADITGEVVGEYRVDTPGRSGGDAVAWVQAAVAGVCAAASVEQAELSRVTIGIQGAVDPQTGRLWYAAHIRGWQIADLVGTLNRALGVTVELENDVNLVAVAEHMRGAARGHQDFVLLWCGRGIGVALMLGGKLHRGATGGAGEVGYMPVPGAPTARETGRHANHGLQALVGGHAVLAVMRSYGFRGSTPDRAVQAAITAWDDHGQAAAARAEAALRDVAVRVATGLAAVTALIDPGIVILTGEVLLAGGEVLRGLVERELHTMTIPRPRLRLSAVEGNPVLGGALEHALSVTREELLASTMSSQ
jgi:predicted NBD/HSP70 family sugar kinase